MKSGDTSFFLSAKENDTGIVKYEILLDLLDFLFDFMQNLYAKK